MSVLTKNISFTLLVVIILITLQNGVSAQQKNRSSGIFKKENLVAWCIVPFDVKKRGPAERSRMLNDLGITKLAYDWRDEHIPTFDDEVDELSKHRIKLQAFWLMSDTNVRDNKQIEAVLSLLKRRNLKTQIWYMFVPSERSSKLTQQERVAEAAKAVAYIAKRADSIGCTVGLYNHEGWFGEPENQLQIINLLKLKNVGLVYNFNHAQEHIDTFEQFYPTILPHLIAVNLAGLKRKDSHIYPITKNGEEVKMINQILKSTYAGPIGIINEDTAPDAAVGLQMNMDGLRDILDSLGYPEIAATYTKK